MAERILRGAIVNELLVAGRYADELTAFELRADGVDPAEYGPLSFIGVLQPTTRTRFAEASGIPRTTVRDMVGRMIDRGHVRESPNPRDGRSTLLELTPAGQAIFDKGQPAFVRALRHIDAALPGGLDAHEEVVWRVRTTLQQLVEELPERVVDTN